MKYIGQATRQEWQRNNRKSWNKSGRYKEQKLRRKYEGK
jgi:hypothetical protein